MSAPPPPAHSPPTPVPSSPSNGARAEGDREKWRQEQVEEEGDPYLELSQHLLASLWRRDIPAIEVAIQQLKDLSLRHQQYHHRQEEATGGGDGFLCDASTLAELEGILTLLREQHEHDEESPGNAERATTSPSEDIISTANSSSASDSDSGAESSEEEEEEDEWTDSAGDSLASDEADAGNDVALVTGPEGVPALQHANPLTSASSANQLDEVKARLALALQHMKEETTQGKEGNRLAKPAVVAASASTGVVRQPVKPAGTTPKASKTHTLHAAPAVAIAPTQGGGTSPCMDGDGAEELADAIFADVENEVKARMRRLAVARKER